MKNLLLSAVVVALVAFAGGCASPDARIKRSPEIFAQLSPEQQAQVKEGQVAIGFGRDAVMLAVGAPDRKWSRTDASGRSEIWSYTTWENDLGQPLYRGWYHRYSDVSPFYYTNYPARKEREFFKVVFGTDGKVTAIEQDSR
ncbi:MAG: hypothetical protein ABW223_09620 [Rariglobus sp.]